MAAVDVESGSSWSSLVCPIPFRDSTPTALKLHGKFNPIKGSSFNEASCPMA
jgi:hypothetical protein